MCLEEKRQAGLKKLPQPHRAGVDVGEVPDRRVDSDGHSPRKILDRSRRIRRDDPRPPISGGPPRCRHTTGRPAAKASATTNPPSSWMLGKRRTSASSSISSRSRDAETQPRNCTRLSTSSFAARRLSRPSSGPLPQTTRCQSSRSTSVRRARLIPFHGSSRPTKRAVGLRAWLDAFRWPPDPSRTTCGNTTVFS